MSGRSWPVMSRISVLLPAPLAPTRPVMPGRSSSVTWLTPITGPYHFETRSQTSNGMQADGGQTGATRGQRCRRRGVAPPLLHDFHGPDAQDQVGQACQAHSSQDQGRPVPVRLLCSGPRRRTLQTHVADQHRVVPQVDQPPVRIAGASVRRGPAPARGRSKKIVVQIMISGTVVAPRSPSPAGSGSGSLSAPAP